LIEKEADCFLIVSCGELQSANLRDELAIVVNCEVSGVNECHNIHKDDPCNAFENGVDNAFRNLS